MLIVRGGGGGGGGGSVYPHVMLEPRPSPFFVEKPTHNYSVHPREGLASEATSGSFDVNLGPEDIVNCFQ